MNVVTIGGATQDIFILYEPRTCEQNQQETLVIPAGKKIDISKVQYASGGGATNTAVSFARLGHAVTTFFKVGSDCQAEFIMHDLGQYMIDLSHVVHHKKSQTSISFIITNPNITERTALVYRDASSLLISSEVPMQLLSESVDLIFVAPLSGQSMSILPTIAQKKSQQTVLAINPSKNQLEQGIFSILEALSAVDIFICNFFEATMFMNAMGARVQEMQGSHLKGDIMEKQCFIQQCMMLLRKKGPKTVVITDAQNGVYVSHDSDILYHPSLPAQISNTLGAGDAFGSAFTATLVETKSIKDAIKAGLVNSKSVIEHTHAKTGLLKRDELQKQCSTIDDALFKKIVIS